MLSALVKVRNFSALFNLYKKRIPSRPDCCGCCDLKAFTTGEVFAARKRGTPLTRPVEPGEIDFNYLEENTPKHFGKIVGLNPEDVEVIDSNLPKKKKSKVERRTIVKGNTDVELSLDETEPNLKTNENKVEIENHDPKLVKLGKNSALLCTKISNLKSKKLREKKQQIVVEGKRLINEALSAGCTPLSIFFSRREDIEHFKLPENVKLYQVCYKNLQLWSDVTTTQGVTAIFKMPNLSFQNTDPNIIPLVIICDNIREPGNLGAILRVAAGVGCEKIILTKGCVDVWEPKVLRGAAGSQFRIPIATNIDWADIDKVVTADNVILADNVNPIEDEMCEDDGTRVSDEFKTKGERTGTNFLPHYYTSFNYCSGKTAIVIGGETQGLSEGAYAYAEKMRGVKVGIPMCNKIESLNIAVALGILCYEVRRQWEFPSKVLETAKSEKEVTDAVTDCLNFSSASS